MNTILGTGIGIGNGGTNVYSGVHPALNAVSQQAMYSQKQQSIDVGMRIIRAENGFIVEIGSYDGGLATKYIAKDMNEVRDLITSDLVTRRMEGM